MADLKIFVSASFRYFQKDFDTPGYCVEGVEHIFENSKACELFD